MVNEAADHYNRIQQANASSGSSGGGGAAQAKDPAGEQLGTHDLSRLVHNISIITNAAGALGVNLGSALNHGGVFQGMDSEGKGGQTIPSLVSSMGGTGGAIWKALIEPLIKGGVSIIDHTGGVGGGESLYASLGNFSPPDTPHAPRGGEMGAGIA